MFLVYLLCETIIGQLADSSFCDFVGCRVDSFLYVWASSYRREWSSITSLILPISTRWSSVGNLFFATVLILQSDIIQDKLIYLKWNLYVADIE